MLLVGLALCLKLAVPAGFMISGSPTSLSITICGGAHGVTPQIAIPRQGGGESTDEHGKRDGVCPFSALAMAGLAGADAPLLVLALAFIVVLDLRVVAFPRFVASSYLQPPLRGPPLPG